MHDETLTAREISAELEALGWRVLLRTLAASVPVPSMERGAELAAAAVRACGADADGHLRVDIRSDRVELTIETMSRRTPFSRHEVELATRVADAVHECGLTIAAATRFGDARPVQALEIAIDALDIPAIRPFWRAVMAYGEEPGGEGPMDAIADPARQGPTIWFQQMDEPRPQRNRIHLDITVAHDEAERRLQAALAAGGRLVSDAEARAFWILADKEGNEICICTWQDRDG